MLPFSLGAALFSAVSGFIVTKTGLYRPVILVAWVFSTIGYGLMYQLDSHSSVAVKVVYPLITAIEVVCLFQVRFLPLITRPTYFLIRRR